MAKVKNIKNLLKFSIFVVIAAITYFLCTYGYDYYSVKIEKIKLDETVHIHITPMDSTESVCEKIEKATQGASAKGFYKLARHNNFDSRKRSGKYAIKNGDTMRDIYNRIVSKEQTPVRITIPSTRDVQAAIGHICKQLMMDSVELAKYTTTPSVLACFDTPKGSKPEKYNSELLPAMFIPDTYEVYWDISPEKLITEIQKWNRQYWNEERLNKAKAAGLTPIEVATLASIVDEETSNVQEMPTVAGLYINRLKKGMLLQADPTVKFAIGDPTRKRILKKDLEVNSPYNTYKVKGLPPGPIRIPTKQALESVLNHKKHDYLYMCAKEDFSGTHNFAKTLSEHKKNAVRYQKALNKLNIKK